ncbi:hypothetical protein D3C71_1785740 [compost metagenome]
MTQFNATEHFRRIDHVQRRLRHRAGQRVAAVGGAMGTHLHHRGNLFGGQHRANREATAKRLGRGQDVWRHAIVHIGEQFATAPHATLHFVEYQ